MIDREELRKLHVGMDHDPVICRWCANETVDYYPDLPCPVVELLDALEAAEKRVESLVTVAGSEIAWKQRAGVVRALHPPRMDVSGGKWCGGCSDEMGDSHEWPCPTIRALDGEGALAVWQDAEDLGIGRRMISRLGDNPDEFEVADVREMGRVAREVVRG